MEKIVFQKVTGKSENYSKVKEIYLEAFPENERPREFNDIIAISEKTGFVTMYELLEDHRLLGIYLVAELEKFNYCLMFAVEKSFRMQGIGTKLLAAILEKIQGKPLLLVIEKPLLQAENYSQRVRRKKFYERNGLYISDIPILYADDEYLLVSNRKDIPLKEYFDEYMEKAIPNIVEYKL